jgi:VanZ family protein
MITRFFQFVGWALAALITYASLGPVRDRPRTTRDPQVERLLAYAALGAALALAYPNRKRWVALGVALLAALLELGQLLVPGRDGHVRDAMAKIIGGLVGWAAVVIGAAAVSRSRRLSRSD